MMSSIARENMLGLLAALIPTGPPKGVYYAIASYRTWVLIPSTSHFIKKTPQTGRFFYKMVSVLGFEPRAT